MGRCLLQILGLRVVRVLIVCAPSPESELLAARSCEARRKVCRRHVSLGKTDIFYFTTDPRNTVGGLHGPTVVGLGTATGHGGGGGITVYANLYCENRVAGLYGLFAARATAFALAD